MNVSPSRPRRRRVQALAPDDRRAALIAATIPLLREHGLEISTRQIADAAGVAEGTIFGVFPDKASLIRAAVASALDPAPIVRALKDIETIGDLRHRLEVVTALMRNRMAENARLMVIVRSRALADPTSDTGTPSELLKTRQTTLDAIASVIEPDRALLRHSPNTVAGLLVSLIVVTGSGFFGERSGEAMHSDETVSLLLDGLLVRPHPDSGESKC